MLSTMHLLLSALMLSSVVLCQDIISPYHPEQVEHQHCLTRQEALQLEYGTQMATAHLVMKDDFIRLHCLQCPDPNISVEDWKELMPNVTWYIKKISEMNKGHDVDIEITPFSEEADELMLNVTNFGHSLEIFSLSPSLHYANFFCKDRNQRILNWHMLEVVDSLPNLRIVKDNADDEIMQPSIKQTFNNDEHPQINLEALTEWHSWSECSQCGDVVAASRRRYGQCVIRAMENAAPEDPNLDYLMKTFGKMPCHSPTMLRYLTPMLTSEQLQHLNDHAPEIMQAACEPTPCAEHAYINLLNSSKRSEQMGPIPPSVRRFTIFRDSETRFWLKCPGENKATYWKRDDETISASWLIRLYGRRVELGDQYQLIFRSLELEDSGMYSCWQADGLLLLAADLHVQQAANKHFQRAAASILLLGLLFIIFVLMFTMYRYYKSNN